MRKLFVLASAALLILGVVGCNEKPSEYGYVVNDNQIVYNTPPRPADQQSMLGFACDPIEHVRVGVIGLGDRGKDVPKRFAYIEDATIVALCDIDTAKIARAQRSLVKRGAPRAIAEYTGEDGWMELCQREDIDLVYLAVPWQYHTKMAVYAMEHGKHVAVEVPAAMNIAECWQLIDTSEKTRKHCMMLENCVYDFFEMTALNMAQQGLFGEIIHVEGAYIHNLDPFWKEYHSNWRLRYNATHKGDVYPTHGIGPVCQVLDIHRGDKMNYLVSMDTKAVHGVNIAKEQLNETELQELGITPEEFANGDHVVTLIRTEKGKQIEIQHNVFTRRPYNRLYSLTGIDGYACKYPIEAFALKTENLSEEGLDYQNLDGERFVSPELQKELMQKYSHPIVADIEAKAKEVGGHGGMDFIMDYRLIYCLRNGLPLDQDVYDAAEWSCLTELSAISIEYGSMPVEIPDFTRGDWNKVQGYRHAVK